MKNGAEVAAFEREFAAYVGAKYAVALCNGTATLHTALVAMGVGSGDCVAVPPLTMSATTMAVLHAGAVPRFVDVMADTWLMRAAGGPAIPVSLYGLHRPSTDNECIDDAAQTLRRHGGAAFTSYSFQASKILALGEGGMLVTDDEEHATRAREFSSLGYRMRADEPRIDPSAVKAPDYARHYTYPAFNYRMNDMTAARGLDLLQVADSLKGCRAIAASYYDDSVLDCPWLAPQRVPDGWQHDYWTYAVACDTPARALSLASAVVRHGGERPYPAWRLTYAEPAFRRFAPAREVCPVHGAPNNVNHWYQRNSMPPTRCGACSSIIVAAPYPACPDAESLQPRLLQFQTNDIASADRNARALRAAIRELG